MNRNKVIDISKYLASIFVIAIHTSPFKNIFPELDFLFVQIVCRFAVPFFAVCTGYYVTLYGEKISIVHSAKQNLFKSFNLYFFWSFLYLFLLLYNWKCSGIEVSLMNLIGWAKGMMMSFSYYHLWYLISMCYGLVFFILYKKNINDNPFTTYFLVVSLWVLQVVIYAYDEIFHIIPKSMINFIELFQAQFSGLTLMLPLLLLGNLIYRFNDNMSDKFIKVGFIISIICLLLEVYILRYIGVERWSFVLMTLPCAFFTFSYLNRSGNKTRLKLKYSKVLATISMIVYCIHPFVINILNFAEVDCLLAQFIFTSVISTIFGLIYVKFKNYSNKGKLQL